MSAETRSVAFQKAWQVAQKLVNDKDVDDSPKQPGQLPKSGRSHLPPPPPQRSSIAQLLESEDIENSRREISELQNDISQLASRLANVHPFQDIVSYSIPNSVHTENVHHQSFEYEAPSPPPEDYQLKQERRRTEAPTADYVPSYSLPTQSSSHKAALPSKRATRNENITPRQSRSVSRRGQSPTPSQTSQTSCGSKTRSRSSRRNNDSYCGSVHSSSTSVASSQWSRATSTEMNSSSRLKKLHKLTASNKKLKAENVSLRKENLRLSREVSTLKRNASRLDARGKELDLLRQDLKHLHVAFKESENVRSQQRAMIKNLSEKIERPGRSMSGYKKASPSNPTIRRTTSRPPFR